MNASRRAIGARTLDSALRARNPEQAEVDAIRSTYRWRGVRAIVLRREPLCRPCHAAGRTELGVEVDHIQPLRAAPQLAFTLSNLQPICKSCHARKGVIERGLEPRLGS